MKPLRSLSGLIDFECAARWGSFKLAARELHKTPAAVSQQVKQLEENVGFPLFVRHPRHISLTEKGQELSVATGRMLADLPHCRLLVEQSPEAWLQLLNENKALKGKYDFSRGYSHWGVLVQAAVAGQGVALVPYGIAFQDIVKGALRQIPARSAPFANGYKFLVNPHKEHMLKVQRFRAWMVGEMEEMRASLDKV